MDEICPQFLSNFHPKTIFRTQFKPFFMQQSHLLSGSQCSPTYCTYKNFTFSLFVLQLFRSLQFRSNLKICFKLRPRLIKVKQFSIWAVFTQLDGCPTVWEQYADVREAITHQLQLRIMYYKNVYLGQEKFVEKYRHSCFFPFLVLNYTNSSNQLNQTNSLIRVGIG